MRLDGISGLCLNHFNLGISELYPTLIATYSYRFSAYNQVVPVVYFVQPAEDSAGTVVLHHNGGHRLGTDVPETFQLLAARDYRSPLDPSEEIQISLGEAVSHSLSPCALSDAWLSRTLIHL